MHDAYLAVCYVDSDWYDVDTVKEMIMITKKRIEMTDRAPVQINVVDWPVVSYGGYSNHDNEFPFQANRTWKCEVEARRHKDGRMLVYGTYDYSSVLANEANCTIRAGVLVPASGDVVQAIKSVGRTLANEASAADHEEFGAHVAKAVRECIRDLPAEEL